MFCARFRAVAMLIQIIFPLANMLLSTRGIRSQDGILFKLNLKKIFSPYRDNLAVSVIYGTASSKTQATASGMRRWLLYLVELNFLTCICASFVASPSLYAPTHRCMCCSQSWMVCSLTDASAFTSGNHF